MSRIWATCSKCKQRAESDRWEKATAMKVHNGDVERLTMRTNLDQYYYICPNCGEFNGEDMIRKKM